MCFNSTKAGRGGFDAESIAEFYPQYSKVVHAQNVSNTSDAQRWIKALVSGAYAGNCARQALTGK